MKTPIRFLFTLLCAVLVSLPSVHAATLTVTNLSDSGVGSLRGELAFASDGDTIVFAPALTGTITLTSGQLEVSKSITINGPGANLLTVDANHNSRVFQIDEGKTVTISGLTITNGNADFGGGIFNNRATLTVNNCTVSGNSATNSGGGIDSEGSGAMVTINNSTISDNSGGTGFGGGIRDYNATMMRINNSTLSGNSAGGDGGGIYSNGAFIATSLTINNSTLSGNSAPSGGGIRNDSTATLTIGSTILNAGSSGANIENNSATVTSNGFNLSSDDASAFLNQLTDQNSTDPMLGPLANNGGPTFTHALLGGSPAIDKGSNPLFFLTDQRGPGFPRTVGVETDVGAFEVQATVCPQPQGYWKNNPNAWPVTSLMLGSQTYTKAELLTILGTPIGKRTKADASLILAYQLIAAKLNIANGADGTPVTSTITNADSLLSGFNGKLPYHVKPSSSTGQAMINDANVLDNFNNGLLTLGCGL